ncbi:MAG TPA: homocysteine S-methyltransferase family protein [Anaerolineae bacterium]|nr:homocysteine S-methyltransferase family protein [Anaerolineae bacterium]
MSLPDFTSRLATGELLILDGATGTELTRRGVDTTLPLWSAGALIDPQGRDVLRRIHGDYIRAGAHIVTANTFRTHRRSLAKGGHGIRARELTHLAVQLVRQAVEQVPTCHRVFVAGSIAPLEDCYSPQLVPPDGELRTEHAEMARHLAEAGVDVMLVETMNTIREARIAVEAARSAGLPVMVSFVCAGATPLGGARAAGEPVRPGDEPRLLSGERLSDAVRAVEPLEPAAIMVNCAPVALIEGLLRALRAATLRPIGAYGNVGHVDERVGWTLTHAITPGQYAAAARGWRALGASVIGGCCGTTPEHIAALAQALHPQPA